MPRVLPSAILTLALLLPACAGETTVRSTDLQGPGDPRGPESEGDPGAPTHPSEAVRPGEEGRVTVRATGQPADDLLSEIAHVADLNLIVSGPVDDPVELDLDAVSPREALSAVAEAAGAVVEETGPGILTVRPGRPGVERSGERFEVEGLSYPVTVVPPDGAEIRRLSSLAIRDDVRPVDSAYARRFVADLYGRHVGALREVVEQAGAESFPGGHLPYLPGGVPPERARVFESKQGPFLWGEVLVAGSTTSAETTALCHVVWKMRPDEDAEGADALDDPVVEAWLFALSPEGDRSR